MSAHAVSTPNSAGLPLCFSQLAHWAGLDGEFVVDGMGAKGGTQCSLYSKEGETPPACSAK